MTAPVDAIPQICLFGQYDVAFGATYTDACLCLVGSVVDTDPAKSDVGWRKGIEAEIRAYACALCVDGVDTLTEVGQDFGEVCRTAEHPVGILVADVHEKHALVIVLTLFHLSIEFQSVEHHFGVIT